MPPALITAVHSNHSMQRESRYKARYGMKMSYLLGQEWRSFLSVLLGTKSIRDVVTQDFVPRWHKGRLTKETRKLHGCKS